MNLKNKMGKHAYLIIANRNPNQLATLIATLDDSRNDIFILLDKKSTNIFPAVYKATYATVTMIDPINIFWGDYSQIEAELALFKSANNGHYDYYHLLSGLDLPLANQDQIHDFFDKNLNKEFITYSGALNPKELSVRLHNYHFPNTFRTDNKFKGLYHRIETKLYSKMPQRRINIDKISFGSNWVSLDNELVSDLVDNEDLIYHLFHNGFLVDELFIPIFINLFPKYKKRVYDSTRVSDKPDEFQGNLRYINWWDGSPYTWRLKDYDMLQQAKKKGHLFSRKFDESIDSDIIKKVVNNNLSS